MAGQSSRTHLVIAVILGIICGFVIGILIGALAINDSDPETNAAYERSIREADSSISKKLMETMESYNIRENLKHLTENPHVAGRKYSKELAEWMQERFKDWGMTSADILSYEVLLSFPSEIKGEENRIELLSETGNVIFTSQLKEDSLGETALERDDLLPPFNAYSPAGIVTGKLVYANYARVEDFHFLTRNLSLNITDKIVIARYGKIYRGDKVRNAAEVGAKGLILYSDPGDYAVPDAKVYPDGIFLPGTGCQRGSTYLGRGDPLTQGYPAKDYAYRHSEESIADSLPAIPVHPIGYDDATEFLKRLDGNEVVSEWRGNLENLTYRYGPGFAGADINKEVRMNIYSSNVRGMAYNTIGMIEGEVEPDRYVIMGNHRDAWAFGAIDASGGTAVMMEVARAFCKMVDNGWRPRRTLVFGSWGAEEQGLIGSTEWVEEFSKNLGERAVTYLNLDVAIEGTYMLDASATPNMKQLVYDTAKLVKDPENTGKSIYDIWVERSQTKENEEPHIGGLGSGSDYASFLQQIGISAFDMSYTYDRVAYPVASYPMYHSVYETFYLVDKLYDPGFKFHLTTGHIMGELMRALSDSLIIPMSCVDYATDVEMYFNNLKSGEIGKRILEENVSLDEFESAVNNFTSAAAGFEERLSKVDKTNPIEIRMFNDQIMQLERTFVDPLGLPGRPLTRHIVFAPSSKNSYASDKFPGIVDAMFDIDNNPDVNKWDIVKQQISIATYTIQSAASSLKPYTGSA
ncbi:putative N-acetylated-alpha-linked acidic dipeptidase [Antedon mediterranea]|uniref:putative N-acetylated-alpha-linked acidic dipeptidase n=1 Tax=Antedon mediterranea TaxID=105859 RepID=UPI003AF7A716